MNATTGAVLAGGQPPPTPGGDFVRLVHYGGWALFALCLLGFAAAAAATMAWKQHRGEEAPEKVVGLVLLGTVLGGTAGAVLGSVT
jgi:hypothetical protein